MQALRKILSFIFFLPFCFYAQVANDLPCTAQVIGALPYPYSCPSISNGDSIVTLGTTLGAVNEPLTYSLISCLSGGNINSQSPDVWFKFIPTAEKVKIKLIGIGTNIMQKPGVSVFQDVGQLGQCLNLIPLFCDIGNSGLLNTVVSDLIPGEHYYIQVRGCNGNTDVGNFKLYIQNANDCIACAQDVSVTSNPLPVAGYYPPNTAITFTYKLQGYRAVANSALKAVTINFPVGMWDTTNVAFSAIPSNATSGNGTWVWRNIAGAPGFYYDQNNDGNITNDAGDAGPQNAFWIFKFTIKTKNCLGTTPTDLSLDFTNVSDGVFFGTSLVCNNDPAFHFKAATNCCVLANVFSSGTSCLGNCNGSITAVASTFISTAFPLGVLMLDAYGNTEGTYSLPTFSTTCTTGGTTCAGGYNVLVSDAGGTCVQTANVQIVGGGVPYSIDQTERTCAGVCGNKAAIVYSGTPPAGTNVLWKGPLPSSTIVSNNFNANSLCAGWYHVIISSSACQPYTDSVEITDFPLADASFSYPQYGCIYPDTIHPSFVAEPGGTFSYSGTPLSINPVTGDILVSGTTQQGNYDIVYTTPGPCVATNTVSIDLVYTFDAGFTWSASQPFCRNLLDTVYANPNFPGFGNFYSTPVGGTLGYLNIDPVTGNIDLANSNPGSYLVTNYISLGTPCDNFYLDTVVVQDTCSTNTSVSVLYNGISPNGDGNNDNWVIPGIELQNNSVYIYNRYGIKIWETENYNNSTNSWKGNAGNGANLPSGTYFYVIKLKTDDKTLKGWIELTE